MAAKRRKTPQFFDDDFLDPVNAATGGNPPPRSAGAETGSAKKKAGFYLSVPLLDRFNRKFHELNLAGLAVENKSALLEAALRFALEDMDKGEKSRVLRNFPSAQ